MIHLKKGQVLKDNPTLVVYDPTGYYRDEDSVICASAILPEEPVCRFEAKFVAYGGIVYSISNPEELMAEVLKIDPETLFGKTNDNIAVDKKVEEIVPQESGVVEQDTPTEEETTPEEETPSEEEDPTPPEIIIPEEPVIPPIVDNTATTTSTTTPETIIPPVVEPVIEPIPVTPTSTPEAVITSTTTSSIVE